MHQAKAIFFTSFSICVTLLNKKTAPLFCDHVYEDNNAYSLLNEKPTVCKIGLSYESPLAIAIVIRSQVAFDS